MTKKENNCKQLISLLEQIKKLKPSVSFCKHLSRAIEDEPLWNISDKQLVAILEKYYAHLSVEDGVHPGNTLNEDEDIKEIIKQGMRLYNILEEEEWE